MRFALFSLGLIACGLATPQVDPTAPRVVSVTPPSGASGVLPRAPVIVCFDHAMQPATATASTVVLSRADGHRTEPQDPVLTFSPDGTCLTLTPLTALAPSSHYQLSLKRGLLSQGGVTVGDKKAATAFTSAFMTAGPAATATLVSPGDGMLNAPSDLAQLVISFSAPVSLSDGAGSGGGPFVSSPGGAPSTLSADGRLASSPFSGSPPGTQVLVSLAANLIDPSGQLPATGGSIEFTMGPCAETTPPTLGEGVVVSRDVDALLQTIVSRPGLCSAAVFDPACPDAGASPSAASCADAYDPCEGSAGCLCTVALTGLCPGDATQVTAQETGFNGALGVGQAQSFLAAPPLTPLVLTEIRGGNKTSAFLEVQNRGPIALDLLGVSVVDCKLSLGCQGSTSAPQAFGPFQGLGSTVLQPEAYALLVDPTFDSAAAPADALLLSPQGGSSLLHLSTTGLQSLALLSPQSGLTPVSTYDGEMRPSATLSIERIAPGASDALRGNWALSAMPGGTPGACNSVTPGADCDP